MVLADIFQLRAHGFRAVVAEELVVIPDRTRCQLGVVLAISRRRECLQIPIFGRQLRCILSRLIETMVCVAHTSPALSVKGNTEDDLVRWDSNAKEILYSMRSVVRVHWRLGRIRWIMEERTV